MAAHAPTTFGGAAPPDPFHGGSPSSGATPSPLSIAALGFELAALRRRRCQMNDAYFQSRKAAGKWDGDSSLNEASNTLRDREEALERAISTMPAQDLVEAAIQIGVASDMAATLDGGDFSAPEAQPSLIAFHRALYLIMLSVLPVFAAAAGLDDDAMGWEDFVRLRKHYFFGKECDA